MSDKAALRGKLAAPFENVQWRLQQTHPKGLKPPYPAGTRGMFMAYIDARKLYDRLDDVFGFGGWQRIVKAVNADGSVIVALMVRVGDEWITHEDIGYPNNPGESHEKEPLKAAVSDGAKRSGVGLGIGRFLYELEPKWTEIGEWGKPLNGASLSTGELPTQGSTASQNSNLPPRAKSTSVNTVPANGTVKSTNTVDAWSEFWDSVKSLGLPVGKKELEKHIGAGIGTDPAMALEKVNAWLHDNARQPALAS